MPSAIAAASVFAAVLLAAAKSTAFAAVPTERNFEYLGCYQLTDIIIIGKDPKSVGITNLPVRCESLCDNEKEAVFKYFALKAGCFCIKKEDIVESKLVSHKKIECTEQTAKVYESLEPQQQKVGSSDTVAPTSGPVETTAEPVQTTAKRVQTTAKPVQTTAKPVQTTAEPVPPANCLPHLQRSLWIRRHPRRRMRHHGGRRHYSHRGRHY